MLLETSIPGQSNKLRCIDSLMLDQNLEFFPEPLRMNKVFQQEAGAQFFHFRLPGFVQIGKFISPPKRDQKL